MKSSSSRATGKTGGTARLEAAANGVRGSRRILFTMIIILLPFLLLALCEIGLRALRYGGNLDLVVTKRIGAKEYYVINRSVAKRYFVQPGIVVPEPPEDYFEIEKSAKTKRIFCLGESTMEGFPYEFNVTAPSFLKDRLHTLLPHYTIEVINVGLSAVGSYVVEDFMSELMKYRPDLFIVYVGHNEFYGAYGVGSTIAGGGERWMTRLTISLLRFKTFLMLRDAFGWVRARFASTPQLRNATLMGEMVASQIIPYGSDAYRSGREVYSANLRSIIDEAQAHGVPVLFSTLVSNVRTQAPFRNEFSPATSDAQKAVWQNLVELGDRLSDSSRSPDVVRAYRAATEIDSLNGLAYFRLGRELFGEREYTSARQALLRAKDLDALRFRATEEFQSDLIDICREKASPLARVDSAFEAASPHGIIGNELILEHLHPNIAGYFVMAKTWCSEIMRDSLLVSPGDWKTAVAKTDSEYMSMSAASDFDRLKGEITVKALTHHWPFQSGDENFTFTPSNPVESIVYRYIQHRLAWSDARYELAAYYAGKKDFFAARRECLAVSKVIPFSYQPLLKIGDYYAMEGKQDDAVQEYLRCYGVEDNPFAHLKLAVILLDRDRPAEAVRQIDSGFAAEASGNDKLQPSASAAARYLLGVAYAKLRRYEEARNALQRALAIEPGMEQARALLKQLPR